MLEFFLFLVLVFVFWGGWKLLKLLAAYEEEALSQEIDNELSEAHLRLQAKKRREAVYEEQRKERETLRDPGTW